MTERTRAQEGAGPRDGGSEAPGEESKPAGWRATPKGHARRGDTDATKATVRRGRCLCRVWRLSEGGTAPPAGSASAVPSLSLLPAARSAAQMGDDNCGDSTWASLYQQLLLQFNGQAATAPAASGWRGLTATPRFRLQRLWGPDTRVRGDPARQGACKVTGAGAGR